MRRCLAIAGVFPPYGGAGAVRQAKLFTHLRACDWQVDVIAPRGRAGWYVDEELEEEVGALRVTRIGLPIGLSGAERLRAAAKDPGRGGRKAAVLRYGMALASSVRNLVAVPDEKLAWSGVALGYARARLASEHYDAVLTSSPPYSTHLAGLGLRQSGGPPWLAEHRDPWANHRFRFQGSAWRRAVDGRLEAAVMRHADAVNVISPGMAETVARRYGRDLTAKLHVITNGFDPGDFCEGADRQSTTGWFELVYVGTLDAGLTPPDVFLEGMARLGHVAGKRVRLRVVGGADLEVTGRLRRWMARHGEERICVDGFVTHQQATRAMAGADALALCLAPGASWVLTSKVFEYLASGRPILAAVPAGDCRDLLERCGGAAIVDPGDPVGLSGLLADAVRAGELRVAPRRPEAIEAYAYPALAARVAEVLSRIAGAP